MTSSFATSPWSYSRQLYRQRQRDLNRSRQPLVQIAPMTLEEANGIVDNSDCHTPATVAFAQRLITKDNNSS